ncbi:MAG: hypothetical protein FWB79_03320 [Treponema sp.]|nr:hypothetical protein [Treponema sp.]
MPVFIPRKLSVALLACAWLVAVALVFLMNHALAGPRLGRAYDFLLGLRSPPPVSQQLLLIETGEVVEPGDVFVVLMALSEMGASDLLVEVPVLGTRADTSESAAEFVHRIDGEFFLLERNIRSLFDAIRLGLLGPEESPAYVESLVELAERGRDRLNAAAMRQEEEGAARMAGAAAAFGNAIMARPQPWAVTEGEIPWYSEPRPDRDGVLRRVAPFVPVERVLPDPDNAPFQWPAAAAVETNAVAEHIAFRALRRRWTESAVEPGGTALVNRIEGSGEFRFPLDRDGNVLLDKPRRGGGFRRVGLDVFLEYDRADRTMARLLRDAWNHGLYAEVRPERIPLILFEHAESLRERMLESPGAEARAAWIAARDDYVGSLDEFLYGPSEMIIVNGYEVLIAIMTEEGLGEGEIDALRNRRNTVMRSFVAMREAHRELVRQREGLAGKLVAAFCIMGPGEEPGSSALFANAMLTGRNVSPGQGRSTIIWPLAAALAALTLAYALGSKAILALGLAGSLLCFAAFGIAFIVSGHWIDPLIPGAAVLGGTLFLSVSRLGITYSRLARFHRETIAKEQWAEFFFGEQTPKPLPAERRGKRPSQLP